MTLMVHTRTTTRMTRDALAQILPARTDGQKVPNSQIEMQRTAIRSLRAQKPGLYLDEDAFSTVVFTTSD
jgi:hypothetical protein